MNTLQHDLRHPAAKVAAKVEPRPATELVELQPTQLGQGVVLAQLARDKTAQQIPHRPRSTSRIRCQWEPAQ